MEVDFASGRARVVVATVAFGEGQPLGRLGSGMSASSLGAELAVSGRRPSARGCQAGRQQSWQQARQQGCRLLSCLGSEVACQPAPLPLLLPRLLPVQAWASTWQVWAPWYTPPCRAAWRSMCSRWGVGRKAHAAPPPARPPPPPPTHPTLCSPAGSPATAGVLAHAAQAANQAPSPPTPPPARTSSSPQIGRAGRDGSEARCVALLDDGDFTRLRSLACSGVLDLPAVRGFLAAVFSPAAEGERTCRGSAKGRAAAAAAAFEPTDAAACGKSSRGRKRKGDVADAAAAEGVRSSRRKRGAGASGGASDEGPDEAAQAAAAEGTAAAGGSGEAETKADADAAAEAEAEPRRRRFGVLAVKRLADELDMREEGMETVLSYLEAEEAPCLRMLPTAALSVKVSFYAAAPEVLAQRHAAAQVGGAWPPLERGMYTWRVLCRC